jgi:hypothetical protein
VRRIRRWFGLIALELDNLWAGLERSVRWKWRYRENKRRGD